MIRDVCRSIDDKLQADERFTFDLPDEIPASHLALVYQERGFRVELIPPATLTIERRDHG